LHKINSKTNKYINRYNLKIVTFSEIDLRNTYAQYRPEYNEEDLHMITSPHYELANLFYTKGEKWLRKKFHKTRYAMLKKNISGEIGSISKKKVLLFYSIRKGYLRGPHKNNYIVVLNKPLIVTRYGMKPVLSKSPEIFMGHHRVGALLALGINSAKVIVAEDNNPGSCQCYGSLHDKYKTIN